MIASSFFFLLFLLNFCIIYLFSRKEIWHVRTHAYEAKNAYALRASANWKAESFDPLAMEIFSMVKKFRGEKTLLLFFFFLTKTLWNEYNVEEKLIPQDWNLDFCLTF